VRQLSPQEKLGLPFSRVGSVDSSPLPTAMPSACSMPAKEHGTVYGGGGDYED